MSSSRPELLPSARDGLMSLSESVLSATCWMFSMGRLCCECVFLGADLVLHMLGKCPFMLHLLHSTFLDLLHSKASCPFAPQRPQLLWFCGWSLWFGEFL